MCILIPIILLPIFGLLRAIFFSRYTKKGNCVLLISLEWTVNLFVLNTIIGSIKSTNESFLYLKRWIYSEAMDPDWSLYFSSLSFCMIALLLIIDAVNYYAINVKKVDCELSRYISYIVHLAVFISVFGNANSLSQQIVGFECILISLYSLIDLLYPRIRPILIKRMGELSYKDAIKLILIFILRDLPKKAAMLAKKGIMDLYAFLKSYFKR